MSIPVDQTSDRCWFGGTCENESVYDITHGYAAFGAETHSVCSEHFHPMMNYVVREVPGWGGPLAVTVVVRPARRSSNAL